MKFIKTGRHSPKPDDEIIREYRLTGDDEWIEILFDRYAHLVFAVSLNYITDEDDAKDIVLRIFGKIPHDLRKYEIGNFSSWLHTVTKNLCLRQIRKNRNTYPASDALLGNLSEEEPAEDEFISKHLPNLEDAIMSLNDDQAKCIRMFFISEMSYRQIAEQTGFTLNQVKSYIQNGKRNLKIFLTKKS